MGCGEGAEGKGGDTRLQGLPQQQPTYLTAGEQRWDTAEGPQRQVEVLHHRGCGERGASEQSRTPCEVQGGPRGHIHWGRYLLC